MRWRLRPTLRATWVQYFRYARGDAQAGMYPERHALRFGVYAGLGVAVVSRRRWLGVVAAVGAVAYARTPIRRAWRRLTTPGIARSPRSSSPRSWRGSTPRRSPATRPVSSDRARDDTPLRSAHLRPVADRDTILRIGPLDRRTVGTVYDLLKVSGRDTVEASRTTLRAQIGGDSGSPLTGHPPPIATFRCMYRSPPHRLRLPTVPRSLRVRPVHPRPSAEETP